MEEGEHGPIFVPRSRQGRWRWGDRDIADEHGSDGLLGDDVAQHGRGIREGREYVQRPVRG